MSQAVTFGIGETRLVFVMKAMMLFGEFSLGTWIVFQAHERRLKGWIVFFVFFAFGIYQLRQFQLGISSCGCFGQFEFSPLKVGILDFGIASIACCWVSNGLTLPSTDLPTRENKTRISMRNILISTFVFLWSSYSWFALSAMNIPISVSSISSVINNKLPILRPLIRIDESIVGMDLDLKSVFGSEVPQSVFSGNWSVFFVRSGCVTCFNLMLRLENTTANPESHQRIIVVSLTPLTSAKKPNNRNYIELIANPDYTWVVATPFCIALNDGKVTGVLDCNSSFLEFEK